MKHRRQQKFKDAFICTVEGCSGGYSPLNSKYCHKHARIENGLYSNYRIRILDKIEIFEKQGRCCANKACRTLFQTWEEAFVDHCHDTDFVRGLLCRTCNTMEGYINANWARVIGLRQYKLIHDNKIIKKLETESSNEAR
jgi:hypothetical protein